MSAHTAPAPHSALLTLPPELLIHISEHLLTRGLSALSRTCHDLHHFLTPLLDRKFAEDAPFLLVWSILRDHPRTLTRTLALGTSVPPTHWGLRLYDYIPMITKAVMNDSAEIVRILLEHGMSPNPHSPVYQHDPPLEIAERRGNTVIAKMLLDAGAEPTWMRNAK